MSACFGTVCTQAYSTFQLLSSAIMQRSTFQPMSSDMHTLHAQVYLTASVYRYAEVYLSDHVFRYAYIAQVYLLAPVCRYVEVYCIPSSLSLQIGKKRYNFPAPVAVHMTRLPYGYLHNPGYGGPGGDVGRRTSGSTTT